MTTTAATFPDSLADALTVHSAALAERWRDRAKAAAPRPRAAEATAGDAQQIVRTFVASLRKDARWFGEVMRLGWETGAAAHQRGLAPHHLLSDAELLIAVVLAAAEQHTIEGEAAGTLPPASAADGIAVARRLHRAGALYTHAAVASFLHGIVTALRARYRLLRHDLRNPVGTIRGALSLMEDETVPIENRLSANVRAMVARNALSLDRLIAANLGDATVESLLALPQETSLRDLALATRRALREPARLAECEIVVAADLPTARVDAVGIELTLSALLLAGLACAGAGDVFRIETWPDVGDSSLTERAEPSRDDPGGARRPAVPVTLRVVHERHDRHKPAHPVAGDALALYTGPLGESLGLPGATQWGTHALDLAIAVAAEFGGRISGTPPEDSAHRSTEVGRPRARRHAHPVDSTALADVATLFVEFPVSPVSDEPPARPRAGAVAAAH